MLNSGIALLKTHCETLLHPEDRFVCSRLAAERAGC